MENINKISFWLLFEGIIKYQYLSYQGLFDYLIFFSKLIVSTFLLLLDLRHRSFLRLYIHWQNHQTVNNCNCSRSTRAHLPDSNYFSLMGANRLLLGGWFKLRPSIEREAQHQMDDLLAYIYFAIILRVSEVNPIMPMGCPGIGRGFVPAIYTTWS